MEEKYDIKKNLGNIVNKAGKVLGKHNGLYNYTIGQRKGLGISNPVPLYVLGFNKEKNEVIVRRKTWTIFKRVNSKRYKFIINRRYN